MYVAVMNKLQSIVDTSRYEPAGSIIILEVVTKNIDGADIITNECLELSPKYLCKVIEIPREKKPKQNTHVRASTTIQ